MAKRVPELLEEEKPMVNVVALVEWELDCLVTRPTLPARLKRMRFVPEKPADGATEYGCV